MMNLALVSFNMFGCSWYKTTKFTHFQLCHKTDSGTTWQQAHDNIPKMSGYILSSKLRGKIKQVNLIDIVCIIMVWAFLPPEKNSTKKSLRRNEMKCWKIMNLSVLFICRAPYTFRHRWYFFVCTLYVSIFAPYHTRNQRNKIEVGDGYWNPNELNSTQLCWAEVKTTQAQLTPNWYAHRSILMLSLWIFSYTFHFKYKRVRVLECVCSVVDHVSLFFLR